LLDFLRQEPETAAPLRTTLERLYALAAQAT
jgi:hypothetical protein